MKPQRVYAELRRVLPEDTIVALDAGAAPACGYDRLSFGRPRTFLTPLDLGGLGFAFPEALGAKLGRPEAPVLAVHDDGGFLMNAQENDAYARLFGAEGYYWSTPHPAEVGDAITSAFACGQPADHRIPIEPNEFPTPATSPRRG